MSDVEKYGLFAVVFVGGLLLVVAFKGGLDDDPPAAVAAGPAPIVLEQPLALGKAPGAAAEVDVKPYLPNAGAFQFGQGEPPVKYPGERSTGAPAGGPASGAPPAGSSPVASGALPATHTVVDGDNLSKIAKRYLGSEARWEEIAALNPGLDPKHLRIGQVLRLSGSAPVAITPAIAPLTGTSVPAAAKPLAGPKASGRTHVVQSGDTLGALAKKYLGSVTRADDIYRANKDTLPDPDHLKLGQVLRIP